MLQSLDIFNPVTIQLDEFSERADRGSSHAAIENYTETSSSTLTTQFSVIYVLILVAKSVVTRGQ